MCLIIQGKSNLVRSTLLDTPGLIDDIFFSNRDGLGVMYHTTRGNKVAKSLPKSVTQAREFIQAFPNDDRDLACHWRMRTHGDIDTDNCHPYKVEGSGWLMHNGVLSTGNSADESKSDTWHYCRDFLDGGVMEKVAHDEGFLALLADHIGSGNKFVMMTTDGRMSIAGYGRGIEVKGLWFSNTYAWSPEMLDPSLAPKTRYIGWAGWRGNTTSAAADTRGALGLYDKDEVDEFGEAGLIEPFTVEEWAQMLGDCDVDLIEEVLGAFPDEIFTLLDNFVPTQHGTAVLPKSYASTLKALLDYDAVALTYADGRILAETVAWYCDWERAPHTNTHTQQLAQPELLTADNAVYAG